MRNRLASVQVSVAQVSGVRVERYDYSRGFAPGIAPHAHEELQICYSINGGGYVRSGRRWQEAPPGSVHVFAPRQEHTAARDAFVEMAASYHVLYISPAQLSAAAGIVTPDVVEANRHGDVPRDRLVRSVRDVIDAVYSNSDVSIIEDNVHELLAQIRNAPAKLDREPEIARKIRDLLHASQWRCPSLVELAAATMTNPHRARAIFRATYGMPPARYHLLGRLANARRLILEGTPLATVASTTGFTDQAHLTNRMRRYFGHTPSVLTWA